MLDSNVQQKMGTKNGEKEQNKIWKKIKNIGNIFKKNKAEPDKNEENGGIIEKVQQSFPQTEKKEETINIELTLEFLSAALNNVERNRSIAKLIFSDEFKNEIEKEAKLTPYEQEIIIPQEQWIIKGAIKGGEYQNPEESMKIKQKRAMLVEKLEKGRDAVRAIDKYDLDIILTTIASNKDWLKSLYLELIDFAVKKQPENPGEIIGGVLSTLTTLPSLAEKKIEKNAFNGLLPREQIKKMLEEDIKKEEIDKKLNEFYKEYLINKNANEEIKKRVFYLIYGTLTNTEKEKLALFQLETVNGALQNKNVTQENFEESFKTYQKLNELEVKINEAKRHNLDSNYPEMEKNINDMISSWENSLPHRLKKRIEEVKIFYPRYGTDEAEAIFKKNIEEINKKIEELKNLLCAPEKKNEKLEIKAEKIKDEIKIIKHSLYPSIGVIANIRENLLKKEKEGISRLDFLKARDMIRDPKIEVGKLANDNQEKVKGKIDRFVEWVEKNFYKFFKWGGFWVAWQVAISAGKMLFKVVGGKAIKDNIRHIYPHAMWTFLPRNIGVIINTFITRVVGAILLIYVGSGLYPDTKIEDLAIKLKLRPPYKIVSTSVKKDEKGIEHLVLKDQYGNEREISARYIKENFRVNKPKNTKYLLNQPEVAVYFEEITKGESENEEKKVKWVLNEDKADEIVEEIRGIKIKVPKIVKKYTINPLKWEIRTNGLAFWKWPTKTWYVIPYEEIKKEEGNLLMRGYLYSKEIDLYRKKYDVTPEDAKLLYKISINYPDIKNLLNKGASEYHIKDAKGFIGHLKSSNWQLGNEIDIDLNASYIEKSLDINKEFGLDLNKLNEETINYLVSMKNNEDKIKNFKNIINSLSTNYNIIKQQKVIEQFKKAEEDGIIKIQTIKVNNDAYTNLVNYLEENGAIVKKAGEKKEEQKEKRPPMEKNMQQQLPPTQSKLRPPSPSGKKPVQQPQPQQKYEF